MRARIAKLANISLITAICGCSTAAPPPGSPAPTAPPVSFDGGYRGAIRVTSAGVGGGQSNWCDTPPVISVSVRNSAFSYFLAQPNLPPDPYLPFSLTFAVTIAPDGSFAAWTTNGGAQMAGRITGSHMAGQIEGMGCGYAFTAERS
jgi:hypothetical protein